VHGAPLFERPTFAQLHPLQLISPAKSLTCPACWLRLEIAQKFADQLAADHASTRHRYEMRKRLVERPASAAK
jgi:hypothetical protein